MGLTSQINDDIRLRFTMSYDIRAPNLGELFNLTPASGGQIDFKTAATVTSALSFTAGNANLLPETATTLYGRHRAGPRTGGPGLDPCRSTGTRST